MQPNSSSSNNSNGDNQFRPVMDVQRPPSAPPPQSVQSNQQQRPNQYIGDISTRPATMEYTRPRPDIAQQFNANPVMQAGLQPTPPEQKKSRKGLVIAIFLSIILLTAGGGGYYYFVVVAKNKPVADQSLTQPVAQEEKVESDKIEATPAGVDKTIENIEQQLNNLDDAQDFNANDVSDESLGLR